MSQVFTFIYLDKIKQILTILYGIPCSTSELTSTTVPTLEVPLYSTATNSTSGEWRPTEYDGCGSYLGKDIFLIMGLIICIQ